jgi:hypothetical protein
MNAPSLQDKVAITPRSAIDGTVEDSLFGQPTLHQRFGIVYVEHSIMTLLPFASLAVKRSCCTRATATRRPCIRAEEMKGYAHRVTEDPRTMLA